MAHHAVSPECKYPAALTAPGGCVAIEGRKRKENSSIPSAVCIKERLWYCEVQSIMCCYLVRQRKGRKRKNREQHANHNIPAEILTSGLYSLKPD